MFKKVVTFIAGVALLCVVGGVVYADACGVFLQDDESAKELVDKYVSFVMKNYCPNGEKISFNGIIKQGCDFWYYNDYNSKQISLSHAEGTPLEVESTEYSIKYDSVDYSNRIYTIGATVTEFVKYKNYSEPVKNISKHIFTIEQNGSEMYIVNDVDYSKTDSPLLPSACNGEFLFENLTETSDVPKVR